MLIPSHSTNFAVSTFSTRNACPAKVRLAFLAPLILFSIFRSFEPTTGSQGKGEHP